MFGLKLSPIFIVKVRQARPLPTSRAHCHDGDSIFDDSVEQLDEGGRHVPFAWEPGPVRLPFPRRKEIRELSPEGSVGRRVRRFDNADVLVHEHTAFKFVHEPNILIIWRTVFLQQVIAQSV